MRVFQSTVDRNSNYLSYALLVSPNVPPGFAYPLIGVAGYYCGIEPGPESRDAYEEISGEEWRNDALAQGHHLVRRSGLLRGRSRDY